MSPPQARRVVLRSCDAVLRWSSRVRRRIPRCAHDFKRSPRRLPLPQGHRYLPTTSLRSSMPSIRDLVAAIRRRDGVEAAVILGRDGLLIDGQAVSGLDAEHIAARIPSIIAPADDLAGALS